MTLRRTDCWDGMDHNRVAVAVVDVACWDDIRDMVRSPQNVVVPIRLQQKGGLAADVLATSYTSRLGNLAAQITFSKIANHSTETMQDGGRIW